MSMVKETNETTVKKKRITVEQDERVFRLSAWFNHKCLFDMQ